MLPGLQGNGDQETGALNQLAQQVADQVNQILTSATTPGGQPGTPLFTYDATSPADVASTLTVDPNLTAAGWLRRMRHPAMARLWLYPTWALHGPRRRDWRTDVARVLEFDGYAGGAAGLQRANGQTQSGQSLAQAQAFQTQISGVSLDAEAMNVMELQQGYEAAGKMVSVIDSLAQTLLNMIPSTA